MLQALGSAEASSRGGLGVVRLAELVGSDKSQISRTLATLAEHGLVERDAGTLSYRIGWQVFALAARAGEPRLLAAAPRLLRELVHQLGESAHLSVRQGASVLTLLSESPASAIHAPGLVGALTPLANTSAGRVLAFDLAERRARGLGPRRDRRPHRRGARARLCDRARGVRAGPGGRRGAGARQQRARRRGRQRLGAGLPLRAPAGRGRRGRDGRGGRALGRARAPRATIRGVDALTSSFLRDQHNDDIVTAPSSSIVHRHSRRTLALRISRRAQPSREVDNVLQSHCRRGSVCRRRGPPRPCQERREEDAHHGVGVGHRRGSGDHQGRHAR